jgi:hypothetical protein
MIISQLIHQCTTAAGEMVTTINAIFSWCQQQLDSNPSIYDHELIVVPMSCFSWPNA